MLTDVEMWLEIAQRIHDERESPFICNIARNLLMEQQISRAQRARLLGVIEVERKRQKAAWVSRYGSPRGDWLELWPEVRAHTEAGGVRRIQFCTEQIRRLLAEGK